MTVSLQPSICIGGNSTGSSPATIDTLILIVFMPGLRLGITDPVAGKKFSNG